MRRIKFDPRGERPPENRGKSGYARINWSSFRVQRAMACARYRAERCAERESGASRLSGMPGGKASSRSSSGNDPSTSVGMTGCSRNPTASKPAACAASI